MDDFVVGVDFLDGTVRAKSGMFFREGVGDSDPDTAGATMGWEAEGCVWTPIAGCLLENDIFRDSLEIWSCDTFAEPLALHLDDIRRDMVKCRSLIPWSSVQPRP